MTNSSAGDRVAVEPGILSYLSHAMCMRIAAAPLCATRRHRSRFPGGRTVHLVEARDRRLARHYATSAGSLGSIGRARTRECPSLICYVCVPLASFFLSTYLPFSFSYFSFYFAMVQQFFFYYAAWFFSIVASRKQHETFCLVCRESPSRSYS